MMKGVGYEKREEGLPYNMNPVVYQKNPILIYTQVKTHVNHSSFFAKFMRFGAPPSTTSC